MKSSKPVPESVAVDWEHFDKNSESMSLLHADLLGPPHAPAAPVSTPYSSPLATPLAAAGAFTYQTTTAPIGPVVAEKEEVPSERPLWVVEVRSLEKEGWIAIPVFTGPDGMEWVCVFTNRSQARVSCEALNARYAITDHEGNRILTWRIKPYVRR